MEDKPILSLTRTVGTRPLVDSGAAVNGASPDDVGDAAVVAGVGGNAVSAFGEKKPARGAAIVKSKLIMASGQPADVNCKYSLIEGLKRKVLSVSAQNDNGKAVWFWGLFTSEAGRWGLRVSGRGPGA